MSHDSLFVEVMQRRLKDFSIHNEEMCGYVEEDCYPELLDELRALGYNYAVRRSEINKGNNAITFSYSRHSVTSLDVHFFGSPFISWKRITLQCILGPNHRQAKRQTETSHPTSQKTRPRVTSSKKMGCPAVIFVKSIKVFHDYVVDKNSLKEVRQDVLRKLKLELESDAPPQCHIRNYIKVSGCHTHSTAVSETKGRMHPALVGEITNLVQRGVASTRDVEINLRRFADTLTKEHTPNSTNKTFFPKRGAIYNHIYKIVGKTTRESKSDRRPLKKRPKKRTKRSLKDETRSSSFEDSVSQSPQPELKSQSLVVQSPEARQSKLFQSQQQLRDYCTLLSDMSYECTDIDFLNYCVAKLRELCQGMRQCLPPNVCFPMLPSENYETIL